MKATGSFTQVKNISYYKISNSEKMPPFFIQVPSASDVWIFLSSKGGITAGRKNAAGNIFPYETDDRLHSAYDTGSRTYIKCESKLWQPFETNGVNKYSITQNIYKSYYGDSVILEEVNHDLKLSYSYKYESSEKFGLVKTSTIRNLIEEKREISVLDGVMNILPFGVNEALQANSSNLVDAYKAAELSGDNLAIYSLTTVINDTPNPIEVMRANIAYTTLSNPNVYLNTDVIEEFVFGDISNASKESYGKKPAYFVRFDAILDKEKEYSFVLDSGYNHSMISEIQNYTDKNDYYDIFEDVTRGRESLIDIAKKADGIQKTGDKIACSHHYLNTLYNVMRGGIFENGYEFNYEDFEKFIALRNKPMLENIELLDKIKNCETVHELKECVIDNPIMYRLALEYMPLSFSRRHGDPARPWNKFNINLKDKNGEKISNYEGNWRDIFQNWEALGTSFPCYYENMVAKFVNASTADGFNPYRINTQGIDWEKPEPENPFGGYGYWGDHQIIYLLRLLKGFKNHFPQKLDQMLNSEVFSYANVPYVLSSYDEILKNSKDTISFDFDKDEKIEELAKEIGSDAKLIQKDGEVYTVNLTEKLLVPLLSKISNLLVGGGIWMNTQRPEWNDANNAIVGIGLSVITVYHVKSYLEFLEELFKTNRNDFVISQEVVTWFKQVKSALNEYRTNFDGNEKTLLDKMGYAFSDYRESVYKNGLSNKEILEVSQITELLSVAKNAIDYTIEKNKGEVFGTYNLLKSDFTTEPMRAMLEGQSAVIGSRYLNSIETKELLSSMKKELFSEKLRCHTLYPIKTTKRFAQKNDLIENTNEISGIVEKDVNGKLHFAADISTSVILSEKLSKTDLSETEKQKLLNEFDNLFSHSKFNGRSEVMYKFEGIGCVYWHQNAKLALAVLETVVNDREENTENAKKLYDEYKELMRGFTYRKSPAECYAIPVEPYSHTSYNGRSEQPGMTGQVKESVLMRRIELGVKVQDGKIYFDKWFLSEDEFDENGKIHFSLYSVPVTYTKSNNDCIKIVYKSGHEKLCEEMHIEAEISCNIFLHDENIEKIEIELAV